MINCVPSLTVSRTALMTQGPRDIFHGLSCLLASLSGGRSKSLALLQGKMVAAKVPFQQIPRFIALSGDFVKSPASVEPTFANPTTELSYDFESQQLRATPTSVPIHPTHQGSDHFTPSVWTYGPTRPEFVQDGFSKRTAHLTFDTAQSGITDVPWTSGMTSV